MGLGAGRWPGPLPVGCSGRGGRAERAEARPYVGRGGFAALDPHYGSQEESRGLSVAWVAGFAGCLPRWTVPDAGAGRVLEWRERIGST